MAIRFEKGARFKDPVYIRLRSVHNSMKQRCYNPNHYAYGWYGAKGVVVCEEWQGINGFIETVDSVEGFDLVLFNEGKLELDKDSKYENNKVYSPQTCRFVSREENAQHKPAYQKETIGLSPEGRLYEFTNHKKFAKEHGILASGIRDCLKGRCRLYKGWLFLYKTDDRDIRLLREQIAEMTQVMIGVSPSGTTYEFDNKSAFAREHGLDRKHIEKAIKNNKLYNGWTFYNKF